MAGQSMGRGKLLVAGAFLTMATAALYLRRLRQKSNQPKRQPKEDPTVPPEVREMFQAAIRRSKGLSGISQIEQLILYSLYKQSQEGDAPESYPGSSFNMVERAKYSAWERLRGMGATIAMLHYIEAVENLKNGRLHKDGLMGGMEDMEEMDLGQMMGSKPSSLANNAEDDGDGYQGKDLTTGQKLLRASAHNNAEEIKSILKAYPELIRHRDEDGQSALHLAADKGAADALKVLTELGADANAADGDGITVLQAAVIAEDLEACRLLLDCGADPDKSDVDGDTPRMCAEEDGSNEMKKLFASHANKT